jgi:hypothetical protein
VKFWTQEYAHFGYQTTTPIEGTHAKYKRWLQSSKGDQLTAFARFLPWLTSGDSDIVYRTQKDSTITPVFLREPRYAAVVRVITVHCLTETDALWRLAHSIVVKKMPVVCLHWVVQAYAWTAMHSRVDQAG